jgi:hypothetical protein
MSRIRNVIEIFDAFLSKRDKVNHDQSIGHEFDPICKTLFGVENGFEFISDFRALVAQLEEDVVRVPYLREEQRTHYFRQLEPLRTLFVSKSYFLPWGDLFQQIAEGNLRNSLLLMDPLLDTQQSNLRQAPDRPAIKAELAGLEKSLEQAPLGADSKRMIIFEINKMRKILQNEKSFKDPRTWEQYQRLTAQLMAVLLDLDEAERGKFRDAFLTMARRIREGLGLPPLPGATAGAAAGAAATSEPAPAANPAPAASPAQKIPFVDWNEPV